jgi:hypothetical protein
MTTRGIDYGLGKTNIDLESGIRYGVIPVNDLDSWIYEEMEAQYGDPSCPKCGFYPLSGSTQSDYECSDCQLHFNSDECFPEDPFCHTIVKDGYQAEMGGDCIDVFVFKSLYFTRAQFCSPCAPGACYLTNPTPEGEKAYCFGHDYFEGDKAPYPVYSVETGKEVLPE